MLGGTEGAMAGGVQCPQSSHSRVPNSGHLFAGAFEVQPLGDTAKGRQRGGDCTRGRLQEQLWSLFRLGANTDIYKLSERWMGREGVR